MHEVRRPDDDELCGFVAEDDGRWVARTVFGAALGDHPTVEAARTQVLTDGLASLADRWTLRDRSSGEEEVVCIVEANPAEVTVAFGYYAMPGVPTRVLRAAELSGPRWELRRAH